MFTSWRGIIGVVHPTLRPGSNEELIRMLPEGIGVLALHVNIKRGTPDEFLQMKSAFEKELDLLKEAGCDVIHPSGAPPFMVHGRKGEAKIIKDWEKKYGIPMFTSGQNHVNALKALKVKSIVGATYFPQKTNEIFSKYFTDAGFKVKAMAGVDVAFNKVQELSGEVVYAHIKKQFLAAKGADAIYMLGSGWRTLHIIEMLEQDLGVPVIHPVPARVWEFQKRLHINEKQSGFGTLLETMPAMV
jgi:maleate isomerase